MILSAENASVLLQNRRLHMMSLGLLRFSVIVHHEERCNSQAASADMRFADCVCVCANEWFIKQAHYHSLKVHAVDKQHKMVSGQNTCIMSLYSLNYMHYLSTLLQEG